MVSNWSSNFDWALTKAGGSLEIRALNRVEHDTNSLEQALTNARRFRTVVEWKCLELGVNPEMLQ